MTQNFRAPRTTHLPLTEAIAVIGWTPVLRRLELGPCHRWEGSTRESGYPLLWGKTLTRLVLEEKLGRPLLDEEYACHSCDYPQCINADHLFPGTHRMNMADARMKGRMKGRTPALRSRHFVEAWALFEELAPTDASGAEIARLTGISHKHVCNVRNGTYPLPDYYLDWKTGQTTINFGQAA